jgi:hypothetical protein
MVEGLNNGMMTSFLNRWGSSQSCDTDAPLITTSSTAGEVFDAIEAVVGKASGTYNAIEMDGALGEALVGAENVTLDVEASRNQQIRADWLLEDMNGAMLGSLNDSDLRLFLAQVRFPFKWHADVVENTRKFRNSFSSSAKIVVPEYRNQISLPEGVEEKDVEWLRANDEDMMNRTGAPELAWRTYFFIAIAASVLAPWLLITTARVIRGDGYVAAVVHTTTERTTMKYVKSLHLLSANATSHLTAEVASLLTKQIWSWL